MTKLPCGSSSRKRPNQTRTPEHPLSALHGAFAELATLTVLDAVWHPAPEDNSAIATELVADLAAVAVDLGTEKGRAARRERIINYRRSHRADRRWLTPLVRHEHLERKLGPGWQRRAKGLDVSLTSAPTASPDLELEDTLPDARSGQDPLAAVIQMETRLEVDAWVARAGLAPREAEVVEHVLRELGGEPEYGDLAEFARQRKLEPNTVYRYWHDAQEKLRRVSVA